MGTVTFSNLRRTVEGDMLVVYADMGFAGTYATGGDAVTPSDVGMGRIQDIVPMSGEHNFKYIQATRLIEVYVSGTTDAEFNEEGNAADLTSFSQRVKVIGK